MSEAAELPSSPYKGLVPFDDSDLDARLFFGREREIELVAANLMASDLTVLYGPSGVGKSSLLRAGVARRLRAHAVPGDGDAAGLDVVIVDVWRDDPVAAVAEQLGAGEADDRPLADLLAERTVLVGGELYLVLDQMEEYFLYHPAGGPLAAELEEILRRPDLRVHVLLGIRDDALAGLDAFKARVPGLFANVLRLDHLDRDGAREAITGPLAAYAELGGAEVTAEPELVEAVVGQTAAGRIEQGLTGRGTTAPDRASEHVEASFLQLVLERLWEVERASGSAVLRESTLAELGGAARIVEQHLDLALASLAPDDRDIASRLFHHLVTPSGMKIAHGVRDLARYADTADGRLAPVLRGLAAQRIVRPLPGANGGGPRYEIFHDVLADGVLAWRARHETERALQREREDARRRHRRLAIVAGLALVALAFMTALAAYAWTQRERASDRARAAEARELTVSALSHLDDDPELSLLLALQASESEQTASVADALRAALVGSRARRVVDRGEPLLTAGLRGGAVATVARSGAIEVGPAGNRDAAARPPVDAAFSPDGRLAALASGRSVAVFGPQGDRLLAVPLPAAAVRVATSSDAVAAAATDGTVVVVGVPGGEEHARFRLPGRPTALALAGDGTLVVAARGKVARVFSVQRGVETAAVELRSTVLSAAVAPDAALIALGASDGGVRTYDLARRQLVNVVVGHQNFVRALTFTPDGERLLSASEDGTARITNVEDGHVLAVLAGHSDAVEDVTVSADGRLAVTASSDGKARVWAAEGDPELLPLERFPGATPMLEGVEDGAARVRVRGVEHRLDVRTGTELPERPAPEEAVPPGWRLEVDGSLVRVVHDGRRFVLSGHEDDVLSARLTPDHTRIVTSGRDGKVRVWDADDGRLQRVVSAHSGAVADARVSPDGRWLVTAGPGAAAVVDPRSGAVLFYLRGHEGPLTGAAFAPDSRTIVTTGVDGTVRTYRCDLCGGLDELRPLAERRLAVTGRTLTAEERAGLGG